MVQKIRDRENGAGSSEPMSKLGELLLEAEAIDKEQLARATGRSLQTGLSLGKILVLSNVLDKSVLVAALEIQKHLRFAMTRREDAIDALRFSSSLSKGSKLTDEENALLLSFVSYPAGRRIRLGELLILAGLVDESDVLVSLERSLQNYSLIGQEFLRHRYISGDLLKLALDLQDKTANGELEAAEAARQLARVAESFAR
jgi:type IV pilus assembly protein PilB